MNDLQKNASEAIHKFAQRGLAFVVDGATNVDLYKTPNGSGAILKTPGGAVVLLTAMHVLEDDPPANGFSIGGPPIPGVAVQDAVLRHWSYADCDVAVALLTETAATRFSDIAFPSSSVAISSDWEIGETDSTVIAGYPTLYRGRQVDDSRKLVEQFYVGVTYLTIVEPGLDKKGRYRVQWDEGVMLDPEGNFKFLGLKDGELQDLTHPGGISGGPLWTFRAKTPKTELWSPEKRGRIVGVASRFLEGVEFAPSVKGWGDWFLDVIKEIDKQ